MEIKNKNTEVLKLPLQRGLSKGLKVYLKTFKHFIYVILGTLAFIIPGVLFYDDIEEISSSFDYYYLLSPIIAAVVGFIIFQFARKEVASQIRIFRNLKSENTRLSRKQLRYKTLGFYKFIFQIILMSIMVGGEFLITDIFNHQVGLVLVLPFLLIFLFDTLSVSEKFSNVFDDIFRELLNGINELLDLNINLFDSNENSTHQNVKRQ